MKRFLSFVLIFLGFGGAIASQGLSVALAQGPHVALIEIDGAIQPSSARFLARGIDLASEEGATVLIVKLNTPGGLLDSTRDMVESILAADIPVVVYVSPAGAQAASAGTFITAAAHVAAMAPTTNIGAASPVGAGEDLPKTLESKAKQDAAAFIRSIAEARGRDSEALEATVLQAIAYSASEALEINIIDLIAKDLETLLADLDGRTVQLPTGEVVLETRGLEIIEVERTPVERFLDFLADPNIAFMLLSLGGLGIFVEIMSPGLLGPGIVGAILMALAFVALGNLPVNWGGVALLALGLLLFFFELQAPGIGIFGVSGAASFILGAFLLFGGFTPPPIETPSFRVNPGLIVGVAAVMFGFLMFVVRDILKAAREGKKHGTTGPTTALSLVGQTAVATTELSPGGTVHVSGEDWGAESDSGEPIAEGEEVIVSEAQGLTLKVFRASEVDK